MRYTRSWVFRSFLPAAAVLGLLAGCANSESTPTASTPPPIPDLSAESRVHEVQIQLPGSGNADTLVTLGNALSLSVAATDAVGRALPGVAVRWASLDTAVAEVSDDGMLRVHRTGTVQLAATVGGTTRLRAFPAITIDPVAVHDLLDDPLVARLVNGLSPTVKGRVQAALAASAGALAAGAAPTLRTLGASVAETLQDVSDPADRAIVALLELYVHQLQRALTL